MIFVLLIIFVAVSLFLAIESGRNQSNPAQQQMNVNSEKNNEQSAGNPLVIENLEEELNRIEDIRTDLLPPSIDFDVNF